MNEIFDYIGYSEDSPTNLIALRDKFMWNGKRVYTKGDIVGSFTHRNNGDPKCIRISFNGKTYYAHNLVWEIFNNRIPNGLVDHIDGNPFNNRIENLREASYSINARNVKISPRNTTGVVGVSLTSSNNGTYVYYEAYVSWLDGKLVREKFPIGDNKRQAFEDACNWRKSKLQLLNALGAGYTERHGK